MIKVFLVSLLLFLSPLVFSKDCEKSFKSTPPPKKLSKKNLTNAKLELIYYREIEGRLFAPKSFDKWYKDYKSLFKELDIKTSQFVELWTQYQKETKKGAFEYRIFPMTFKKWLKQKFKKPVNPPASKSKKQ